MGTTETNDDGALGLERFDEMTGPMDNAPSGILVPASELAEFRRVQAVIADEQRMADVFAECAKAVAALRGGIEMLDEVAKGMKDQPRFRTSLLMEAAASSLENAIARANGGAA